MRIDIKHISLSLFLALVLAFLIPFLAMGRPHRVALLPDKGKNFGCGTCHVNPDGGGARNSFGRDWELIAIPKGDKYVPEIANRDSDGDGFTNDEEFNAGKNPGDSNSKPDKPRSVKSKGRSLTTWGRIKFFHPY